MHGVVARRMTRHYGWTYDYEGWTIEHSIPKTLELRYSITMRTVRRK